MSVSHIGGGGGDVGVGERDGERGGGGGRLRGRQRHRHVQLLRDRLHRRRHYLSTRSTLLLAPICCV